MRAWGKNFRPNSCIVFLAVKGTVFGEKERLFYRFSIDDKYLSLTVLSANLGVRGDLFYVHSQQVANNVKTVV